MNNPVLLIRDPQIIRDVLITDFWHFSHRGAYENESDPLSNHLALQHGGKWKRNRIALTPTFTPFKLKEMFNIMAHSMNIPKTM